VRHRAIDQLGITEADTVAFSDSAAAADTDTDTDTDTAAFSHSTATVAPSHRRGGSSNGNPGGTSNERR
jgi:hypothetical protein